MSSSIFIDHPRFAVVIAMVITLAGATAIAAIPIAQFPDMVPPQVTLTVNYPGADAEVVETTAAQPIEEQINGVDNRWALVGAENAAVRSLPHEKRCRDRMRARIPASSGLFAMNREISVCARLRGIDLVRESLKKLKGWMRSE